MARGDPQGNANQLGHSQAEQSTAPIGAAQGHLQRVSQLCGPYWYWGDVGTVGPMGSSCCPPWQLRLLVAPEKPWLAWGTNWAGKAPNIS